MSKPDTVSPLRMDLVRVSLEWQEKFGVAPAITSALSEFDAAMLLGLDLKGYSTVTEGATAVRQGFDFEFPSSGGARVQVKANRPSGRPGSRVTKVGKAKNYDWDVLIWILYDREYSIQEAWKWQVGAYRTNFEYKERLSPADMRLGEKIR